MFTHASVVAQPLDDPRPFNYERLEFLGDAQIELIASLIIYDRFQASTPGKMSTVREALVGNDTLSKFSRMYGFDKKLRIKPGAHGPKDWTKIHGDLFEAYVAAVILSDVDLHYGLDTATRWLTQLWLPKLQELALKTMPPKDMQSKEILAKSVLVKGAKMQYQEDEPPIFDKARGKQTFFMAAIYTGLGYENQYLGSGQGENKNLAGQDAAKHALQNPILEDIKKKRAAFLEERDMLNREQQDKEQAEEQKRREERDRKEAEKLKQKESLRRQ